MVILIFTFLLFTFISVVAWIAFLIVMVKKSNPYIKAHKLKNRNDKDYNDYLEWVHKNKFTTPYNKLETLEEQIENYKLKNLLK